MTALNISRALFVVIPLGKVITSKPSFAVVPSDRSNVAPPSIDSRISISLTLTGDAVVPAGSQPIVLLAPTFSPPFGLVSTNGPADAVTKITMSSEATPPAPSRTVSRMSSSLANWGNFSASE